MGKAKFPLWVLCTTLPLDIQGGIQGGLDAAFRFGNITRTLLDSDFRRIDEVVQSTPWRGLGRGCPFRASVRGRERAERSEREMLGRVSRQYRPP